MDHQEKKNRKEKVLYQPKKRTKRKVTAVILWLLLLCLLPEMTGTEVYAANPESAPGEAELYAASAVLMDADTGRVLYEKEGDVPGAIASTTKILTCILALEQADPEEEVYVSEYAASMPKVKLYVRKGEKYLLKDLLYSLMLESHNDSAVVIAEHIGKRYLDADICKKSAADYRVSESKEAVMKFAELMNQKAEECGCKDSFFITPNGLDATVSRIGANGKTYTAENESTAADIARIMSYCVKKSEKRDKFLEITQTVSWSFQANERSFLLTNHNAFLHMMDGVISGKTGFTNKAGYCYVCALESDGRTFVVSLLACGWPGNRTYKWSDARKLLEYACEHFELRQLDETLLPAETFSKIPVTDSCKEQFGAQVSLIPVLKEPVSGSILLGKSEKLSVNVKRKKTLQAPVQRGENAGRIQIMLGDEICKEIELIAPDAIDKISFAWCFMQIACRFLTGV